MRCELYMRHVKDGVYSDFTAEEEELLPKKLTAKEEELLVSSLRYSLSFVALLTKMIVGTDSRRGLMSLKPTDD